MDLVTLSFPIQSQLLLIFNPKKFSRLSGLQIFRTYTNTSIKQNETDPSHLYINLFISLHISNDFVCVFRYGHKFKLGNQLYFWERAFRKFERLIKSVITSSCLTIRGHELLCW